MRTATVRIGATTIMVGVALGMLSACSPDPQPSPTPTETPMFASEEEAFAAAEETYRAYVDAGNQASGEDAQSYLAGTALEGHIDANRALAEAGLRLEGSTELAQFKPESLRSARDGTSVEATVCLDLSKLRTVSQDGSDVTPLDRPEIIAMRIEMAVVGTKFLIFQEQDEDNASCVN